jgi:hypothetical protein
MSLFLSIREFQELKRDKVVHEVFQKDYYNRIESHTAQTV